MLIFQDSQKVGGIPNKIFTLVIIATIGQLCIFRILIDGNNSYDIIYLELFENVGFERGSLWSFVGSNIDIQRDNHASTGGMLS